MTTLSSIVPPHDKMNDGFLRVSADGIIVSADTRFCELMGMVLDEVEGRAWHSLFHPLDRLGIEGALLEFDIHKQAHLQVRGVRPDGVVMQLYLHLCYGDTAPDSTDYFCLVMNLATRINFTSEKVHYERLFEISNDLLCIATTMGYFLQVNPAFTRLLGYTAEELLNTTFLDFIHPDDISATLTELRNLRSGMDTLYFENRYRCKNGEWRWLAWSTPASSEDGILYAVAKDITERKQFEDQLLRLAKFDFLSGLPNRSYLDEELKRAMARAQRNQQVLTGYFIDLDGFKEVNDQHGHDVGDDLIRQVAIRLRTLLRNSDFVARIGGDEFFVIAEFGEDTSAAKLANKMEAAFQFPFALGSASVNVGASVGFAIFQRDTPQELHAFIAAADQAMYRNKRMRKSPPKAQTTI